MTLDWLKEPIIKYISNHENVNSVDIVNRYRIPANIVFDAMRELETACIIAKDLRGAYFIVGNRRGPE